MVRVTLKTTLTNNHNRHPPGTRTKPRLPPSPGVLPGSLAPLLVLAPDERRSEDQEFSESAAHYLLLPKPRRGPRLLTTPALVDVPSNRS